VNPPRKFQIGLGALLFTVGFLLEAAAVTAFVARPRKYFSVKVADDFF